MSHKTKTRNQKTSKTKTKNSPKENVLTYALKIPIPDFSKEEKLVLQTVFERVLQTYMPEILEATIYTISKLAKKGAQNEPKN